MSCCSQPCASPVINNPCSSYPYGKCVIYTGPPLPCIGSTTNERLDSILQKIDGKLCDSTTNTITLIGDVTGTGTSLIDTLVTWSNGYPTYDARYFLRVKEADDSPNVRPVTTIVLGDNLSMTDDGGQQITINAAADIGCCSLQATCDVGYTTTTSIIIGSSNTAHSGTTGQLVQGTSSSASLAASNGVALNAGTTTGITATAINSAIASGSNSFAAGSSTASGFRAAAFGTINTASGQASIATGESNTVSGINSSVFGKSNSVSAPESMAIGQNNVISSVYGSSVSHGGAFGSNLITSSNCFVTGRDNNSIGGEGASCIGVANTNLGGEFANGRGAVCIGGVNTTSADFAVAIGNTCYSSAKGGVAMGSDAKAITYGEIAIASGHPSYSGKTTNIQGMCQTSIVTLFNHDVGIGNSKTLSVKICTDTNGNAQSCGAGDVAYAGLNYVQVDDNTVHYIQGRLIGVTSTGDITVWTIDTYFKNVAGVITAGATAFTSVLKDTAFTNMDSATLTFTTTTGNLKSMTVVYHNTGAYPVAEYSCTCTINKLTWKA